MKIVKYKATLELHTPWWKKLLRFFHLKAPREEFILCFNDTVFEAGDIATAGTKEEDKVLILKREDGI